MDISHNMTSTAPILYLFLLIIGVIIGVAWLFLPFVLVGKFDKVIKSLARIEAQMDAATFALSAIDQAVRREHPTVETYSDPPS